MLGKLIKYEFKGSGRVLLPLYGLILALAIITKIFNGMSIYEFGALGSLTMGIVAFAYGLTMMAVMLVTMFLIIQRFFATVYGDEGYLTHTLPVKSRNIIISKALAAICWISLSSIVAVTSVIIIGYQPNMFADLFKAIEMLKAEIGAEAVGQIIYVMANMTFVSILASVAMIIIIYMCISIGQLFKRKFAGSIMAFVGVSFVVNLITGVVGNAMGESGFFDFIYAVQYANNAEGVMSAVNHFVWILSLFYVIKIVVYYFITNHLMTKKLNLE